MKKQFFRVKQLADQTFLRAEKSEQLSNELQEADHKVEYLRAALAAIAKRLPPTGNVTGDKEILVDKRLKKTPEYLLGLVMKEYGEKTDDGDHDDCLLRPILTKCGKVQMDLAREQAEHEQKVEQMVSSPVQKVLECEVPAILKSKRTLSKLVLDKDSASNRYQTASKHGTKNEALRDEMEEAEQKVSQCRDNLATEMFSLLRRESDLAQCMLQLIKLQRGYHESALKVLEDLIPKLEKEIGDSPVKAVYGCPLEEHLRLSKRQIALPLELCVCALWELGMTEEGLFRVAGGTSRVRRMKLSLDSGCFSQPLQTVYRDVHVIASALKSYLRELPEPLLTYHLYDDWIKAAKCPTEDQRIDSITQVLSRLPEPNYDNLRYLIKFLAELSKNPSNKMTSSNIAIVIAPNLMWSRHEMHNGIDMSNATVINSIVEMLVSHEERFFPGELEVYQTFKRDELFADLTEFERPQIAHLRSSSNDTALIQLDPDLDKGLFNNVGERSSPPQGSPKPFMRRKNKPAPNPPMPKTEKAPVAFISGSSTINRTTYKQAKAMQETELNGKNKMSVSVGTEDFSIVRRKSLDFDHPKPNCAPLKKPEGHISKCDISSPISTETTANIDSLKSAEVAFTSLPLTNVHTIQSTNIHQITAQNATVGKIKVTSDNLQQKANVNLPSLGATISKSTTGSGPGAPVTVTLPVAAPRISLLEAQKSPCPKSNQPQSSFGEQKPPGAKSGQESQVKGGQSQGGPLEGQVGQMSKSLSEMDMDGEVVQLRRASKEDFLNRPSKPVVPERPATLRPSSFRISRQQSTDQLPEVGLTTLERTHMYSVPDKQQVSIVQVAMNKDSGVSALSVTDKLRGHDTQMAEKEKFLMTTYPDNAQRVPLPRLSLENNKMTADVNSNLNSNVNSTVISSCGDEILVRTQSVGARPGRPPKPEVMKSLERIDSITEPSNGNGPHHARTHSDGDIIDAMVGAESPRSPTQPPASPRCVSRPPRPQPPPPPPPVRPKSEGESTDL